MEPQLDDVVVQIPKDLKAKETKGLKFVRTEAEFARPKTLVSFSI